MAAHDVEMLWALARGQLNDADARSLRAHLNDCGDCAHELAEIEAATRALSKFEVPERSSTDWSALDAKVMAAAKASLERRGLQRLWDLLLAEKWVAAGVLAALAILIAVWVGPFGGTATSRGSTSQQPAVAVRPSPPAQAPIETPRPEAIPEPTRSDAKVLTASRAHAGRESLGAEHRLSQGSIVETAARGEAVVALAEGSVISVRHASATKLASIQPDEVRIELDRGEVVVAASHREGRRFEVVSGGVTVRVVGTRFSVEHDAKATRVRVVEGRVRVTDSNGEQKDVSAGEQLTIALDQAGMKLDALTESARRSLAPVIARLESLGGPDLARAEPRRPSPATPPVISPEPRGGGLDDAASGEAPAESDHTEPATPGTPLVLAQSPEDAGVASPITPDDTWAQPFASADPFDGGAANANATPHVQDGGVPWLNKAVDGMKKWLDVDWNAPFPPVGMSMEEYGVRQMEHLADAGYCKAVLRKAGVWLSTYARDGGPAPDPELYRTVQLTRARCERKLR